MNRTKSVKYCLAAFISLITFVVYLRALQNGFVEWDDNIYIFDNPFIRSLDLFFFRWAFFDFHAGNWHPLTWISHGVDYALWGLNPFGHHLTNIVLHAINTYIVVLLVSRLLEIAKETARSNRQPQLLDRKSALITAGVTGLLFGLHPAHVESVAWVAERKDLLSPCFSCST